MILDSLININIIHVCPYTDGRQLHEQNRKQKQQQKGKTIGQSVKLPEVMIIQEPTSRWKTFALKGHNAIVQKVRSYLLPLTLIIQR